MFTARRKQQQDNLIEFILRCTRPGMAVKRYPEDIWFSKAIRESYDYTCCSCETNWRHVPEYVHCAHIHTRKHRSTRWNADYGALALCAKCHRRFTDYPLEWADFVKRFLGSDNYDEAKRLAWETRKYTKAERKEIAAHYRRELHRIEAMRMEGITGYIKLVSYD